MSKLLTIEQVAEKLSVSESTINRWIVENKIPVTILPGGQKRFEESKIEKWISSRTINAKAIGV